MLIPSTRLSLILLLSSLSRRVNANSQLLANTFLRLLKLIKKGEC